ncbi:MAG: ATP-binding protein [Bacteroidia bacterium]|nr:ATP-binding protein [Bacteroidia bacterium]
MQNTKPRYNFNDITLFISNKIKQTGAINFCQANYLIPGDDKKELWLSKYFSAFANSGGGTIIFGIKKLKERANELDEINFNTVSDFWLKNLIENEIYPKIENVEVYEIQNTQNSNKGVIVVNIPKSNVRPHMALDNRYYFRVGNKTEMMLEQHVREMYNVASVSNMEFIGIVNTQGVPTLENGKILNINFYPKFLVKNSGSAVESNFKFELWLPSEFHDSLFSAMQNYFNRIEGRYSVFSVPNRQSVFQNEICNILEAKIFVNYENINVFNKSEIIIKLYYSNGLKEFNYSLKETFTFENQLLQVSDFVKKSLT